MINKESLTAEWIDKVSKANRNADKILVEKVIRALLLLDSAKRLSIDIDIILTEKKDNLDELLKAFAEAQGFSRVELQHRAAAIAIEKALKSGFLITSAKLASVNMPSLEDLLGDKLTAFAPNTTGIPYFKKEDSMSMEIIKQLYDIGNIFDVAEDLDTVKETFNKIAATEIAYRELKEGIPADVLDDIYQTSLCLCLRGAVDNENFDQLQKGIQRVEHFIFSESYHLDKAIVHAAKAAYLSRLIATGQQTFEKFTDPKQVAEAIIEQPHNTKLNKLKKSSPEAFFYWWKAISLS